MAEARASAAHGAKRLSRGRSRCASEGHLIQDYPDDRPYPSALFLGWVEEKPVHVVVSLDEGGELAYVITAYEPSLDHFAPDYKTRRKR